METLGIISCDKCGNEITLEQDDKDFTCDVCDAQCCCECISESGDICCECKDVENTYE